MKTRSVGDNSVGLGLGPQTKNAATCIPWTVAKVHFELRPAVDAWDESVGQPQVRVASHYYEFNDQEGVGAWVPTTTHRLVCTSSATKKAGKRAPANLWEHWEGGTTVPSDCTPGTP